MALDRLTKIDGGGISTTSDYRVGVITATKFVGPIEGVVTGSLTGTATTAVNAQGLTGTPDITVRNINASGILTASSANFSGNVSIGGTLTYEDVTNIDSVGIITARDGLKVLAGGVNIVGVVTATGADINGDIDVDGHTNLDNVNIAGVTTASGNISVVKSSGSATISVQSNDNYATLEIGGQGGAFIDLKSPASDDYDIRFVHDGYIHAKSNINLSPQAGYVVNVNKNLNCAEDLDVDGHTNLDNVSIAGMSTITGANIGNAQFTGSYVNVDGNLDIADSIRHLGDSNTKIRFPSADTITFETAGSEALRIKSDGKVGINEANPQGHLHVENDNANASTYYLNTDAGILIQNKNSNASAKTVLKLESPAGGGDCAIVYGAGAQSLIIADRQNERLRITSDGKIGINEASNINGRLHVQHDALGENILYATRYNDQTNDKPILAVTEALMTGMTASGLVIGTHNRPIHFGPVFDDSAAVQTAYKTGIRISYTGKVGINSTSPREKLDVGAGRIILDQGYQFTWANGTTNRARIHGDSGSNFIVETGSSNTEALRITSTGEVRIPTGSNSTSRLTFGGGINIYHDGNMKFENATGYLKLQSANNLYIDGAELFFRNAGGTERLRIDSNGNISHNSAGSGFSYFKGSSEYIFGSQYSSPPAGGVEADFQIHTGKSRASASINAYYNNAGGPFVQFVSSRSNTKGVLGTKSAINDYIGDIRFMGDNGTNYNSLCNVCQILVRQKSTISDGDTSAAGEFTIRTGDGGGSVPERFRIDQNGRLTLSDSEGIKLSAKTSTLYSQDGSLSYYATDNGVYLNGAGANGFLRLNASGVTNSRTCIDINGQSNPDPDAIYFRTATGNRLRILQNGQLEVMSDEGIFLKPVTNGGGSNVNGARIRFSDNSNASHSQIGEFRYKHSDSSVISAAQNNNVNSNDAFHLFGSETLTVFRIDANTHIYNDYGLWIKTTTQGGLSGTGGTPLRFSSNAQSNYNQIGEINYQHNDDGITTGFKDGFVISGTDGQSSQQYGAQRTIVKVNGSLQATGNVWGVGSVCQIVRGTDQIVNNQNPPQSPAEIASGFRTSITLRTVNPYIKVTFYANPELDGASMRSAIYFYYSKNSGSYGTFQRPVWFGATTDSGNQQGGYSMLGVVGQVTGNRGDTFTFSPYWAEEADSTANYMFGQTWPQFGNVPMASFMYLEEIATQ